MKAENLSKCPQCGYRFTVLEETGKPECKEENGGLTVSVKAWFSVPNYCPRCGYWFREEIQREVDDLVKRTYAPFSPLRFEEKLNG